MKIPNGYRTAISTAHLQYVYRYLIHTREGKGSPTPFPSLSLQQKGWEDPYFQIIFSDPTYRYTRFAKTLTLRIKGVST